MSVTYNPNNNPSPRFFKLIPEISVLLIVSVIIPFGLFYISFLITGFFVNLLHHILLEGIFSFISIFFPITWVAIMWIILWFYLLRIPKILDALPLDIRKKWIDYISYKGQKINFYRLIAIFRPRCKSIFSIGNYIDSKTVNVISKYAHQISAFLLVFPLSFFIIFAYTALAGEKFFNFNVLESQNLMSYLDNYFISFQFGAVLFLDLFVSIVTSILLIFTIFIYIEMMPIVILRYLFSSENGIVDTSDIPICFTKLAIQQLETVDFLENLDEIQHKKNQISNFLEYSLEFVKVDKDRGYPDYMNFCSQKYCFLLSSYAVEDIIFRINGLYENMNNTLIKINHMNCLEEKNVIMKDLEIYLNIIESKDLSKIEPKRILTKELTIDKAFSFSFKKVILPVTLVVLAQWLI